MTERSLGRTVLTWTAQLLAALILFFAAAGKFTGAPHAVEIFETLGMEPYGRYLVGCFEVLAALFLVTPLAAVGAVLAVMVMTGALFAHLGPLGLMLDEDGGLTLTMFAAVLLCAGWVAWARRRELPLIGPTL